MKRYGAMIIAYCVLFVQVFSATVLKPIENLRVLEVTNAQVKMTWEEIKGASSYEIFRAKQGKVEKIGETNLLNFTDTTVVPKSTYYYSVVAKNDVVKSEESYHYNVQIPDSGSMTIPEKFKVFQEDEVDNVVIKADDKSIVFKSNEKTKNIKVGDLLLGYGGKKVAYGLFYKATSVKVVNGNIKVDIEFASMEEAFAYVDNFSVTTENDFDFSGYEVRVEDGVEIYELKATKSE